MVFFSLYSDIMESFGLKNLLKKEMTRKEFFQYLGLFILTLTGIAAFMKTLRTMTNSNDTKGFGTGKYGV